MRWLYIIVSLKRYVNCKERYYQISLLKSLFDSYIVECTFGNISYLAAIGTRRVFFNLKEDALTYLNKIVKQKLNKGYISQCAR